MARIAGVDLPNKATKIALTYIYGIGRTSAVEICKKCNVDPDANINTLSADVLAEVRKVIEDNFVYIHVNFTSAKDEKSQIANKRLANAGRFGFPVLVVLREDGSVMHIQNSSYLEEGKGYHHNRVLSFFQNWTPAAVNGQTK